MTPDLSIDTTLAAYQARLAQLRAIISETRTKVRHLSRLSSDKRRQWIRGDPLLIEVIELSRMLEQFLGDLEE